LSSILETHARREIFGYPALVLSQVANAFIGFGLWVHHMFATGLPQIGEAYFTASSMMIAVTSGIQIFCWLATLWTGRPRLNASMHFILGFVFIFVLGGLSGVMLASIPLDLQVHDTFFVVAHFHYVLIGGALFPLFGAFHHWYPKMTGKLLNDTVARIGFWFLFIGFNLTFFPMHILGLKGMPRRIYTYPSEMGWDAGNLIATVGAYTIALGGLIFTLNVLSGLRSNRTAGEDPWDAATLEWATASPPQPYNFDHLPVVDSRYPLWDPPENRGIVTGLRSDRREALVTSIMDAEPQFRLVLPGPSIWPFLTALGTSIGLFGSIFFFSSYYVALLLGGIGLVGWFWPRRPVEIEP